ncbi:MAG TPA: hypothetical protein EYN91_22295 [Candidatus Melainabacteria bacterium]|nr:hypothetical protein [Candidatus Melainabacteria bacterium]HIN63488.1 hypothetical protein [Candidatus Obscuribacterales bacterium]
MPPLESAPEKKNNQDPIFVQSVFDELVTEYPKDPARFAHVYNQLKAESDNPTTSNLDRAESCKNLCLLDFAVSEIKAKSGDAQAAKVMYNDGATYLDRLEESNSSENLRVIKWRVMKEI